jgi:dodecin
MGAILIVDADPIVRSVVRSLLNAFGYRVLDARDGCGAIRRFEQYHCDIDTVILPLHLPEVTGAELARYVQTRNPATEVILMCDGARRPCALQTGWRIIQKPFTARLMIDCVRCGC